MKKVRIFLHFLLYFTNKCYDYFFELLYNMFQIALRCGEVWKRTDTSGKLIKSVHALVEEISHFRSECP